jgi:serine/threonine protein kinase
MNNSERGVRTIIIKKISGKLDPLYIKYNLNDISKKYLLGKGTFSHVYKTYNSDSLIYCAIKILKTKHQHYSKQEIYYLTKLGIHENIIQLLDYFNFKSQICMIYPLYNCNLYQLLSKKHKLLKKKYIPINRCGLKIQTINKLILNILTALQYIKTHNIVHADLKPENILIDRDDSQNEIHFILCDFGSAYDGNSDIIEYKQSRFYRAPETILRENCSYEIDMWSMGCILYEVLFNRVLFRGKNELEQIHKIVTKRGMFTTKYIDKINYRKRTIYFEPVLSYNNGISNNTYTLKSAYSISTSKLKNFWRTSGNTVSEDITRNIMEKNKVTLIDENIIL